MARYKEGNTPPHEVAPRDNRYPLKKRMQKGNKLRCAGCNNGQTAKGSCKGCKGTGFIEV